MGSNKGLSTRQPAALPHGATWRTVHTPQHTIGYVLVRSRRKSIALVVGDDGLQIRAPHWVTLKQIDVAVSERADWVMDKLRIRQQRHERQACASRLWEDGGVIPYMGAQIVLTRDPNLKKHHFHGVQFAPADGDRLTLALPPLTDADCLSDTVQRWLQQQAEIWFEQRLHHFLDRGQLHMQRWRLSSAKTRWGSCSSQGNIMLNWRLIHFKHSVIDYVIAHEVAHLREMNHGKNFWLEVQRLLPDYQTARAALRQHSPGLLPLL